MERRISGKISGKSRRQARPSRSDETESADSVADRFRPWSPRGAKRGRASPALCPARPRQAEARLQHASTRPLLPVPPFSHFASSLLAVASVVLVLPRRRHCRRSAELACASHRCIRQLVALSASPQPSPSFPPCLAQDRALGEPLLALHRRGNSLAGVPPWPLPWPYFVGAPQAS